MRRNRCARYVFSCAMAAIAATTCSTGTWAEESTQPAELVVAGDAKAPGEMLQLARQHERAGRVNLAVSLYRELAERFPKDQQPLHRLAVLAAQQGRFDEADILAQYTAKLGPLSADMLCDHGFMRYQSGDLDAAEETLRKALDLEPNHVAAANNLGLVLATQQRMEEALAEFERCGSPAEARANLAYISGRLGWLEFADEQFAAALEIDPTLEPTLRAMWQEVAAEQQHSEKMPTPQATAVDESAPEPGAPAQAVASDDAAPAGEKSISAISDEHSAGNPFAESASTQAAESETPRDLAAAASSAKISFMPRRARPQLIRMDEPVGRSRPAARPNISFVPGRIADDTATLAGRMAMDPHNPPQKKPSALQNVKLTQAEVSQQEEAPEQLPDDLKLEHATGASPLESDEPRDIEQRVDQGASRQISPPASSQRSAGEEAIRAEPLRSTWQPRHIGGYDAGSSVIRRPDGEPTVRYSAKYGASRRREEPAARTPDVKTIARPRRSIASSSQTEQRMKRMLPTATTVRFQHKIPADEPEANPLRSKPEPPTLPSVRPRLHHNHVFEPQVKPRGPYDPR